MTDALPHINAAIDALTNEAVRIDASGEHPVAQIECTVADDLDRMVATLGAKGSLLAAISAEIRVAIVELFAARDLLREGR